MRVRECIEEAKKSNITRLGTRKGGGSYKVVEDF